MTRTTQFIDRLLTALLGVVLLTSAVWLIGYGTNSRLARRAAAAIDPQAPARALEWPWLTGALAGAGVAAFLVGLWLLLVHVRPTSVRSLGDSEGKIDLSRLADAAADDLARHPSVQTARAVTLREKGRPVVRVTVGVSPHTSTSEIRHLARQCGADVRRAANSDLDFQLLVKDIPPEKVLPQVV
ncbi:hypothetical protein [Mycobacteroides chelonae]|uniref:Alkaline shock response membrane anchor protein AmaP n=1 Tax=Mycobacteroides chelonae TaxID=1774 RepID=A0A1S1M5X9_MYCCH|nr:hypothetical protein [Mycobacteroides chelonae]OHU77943.1 hypothetical protein BKG84_05610 [Mycobacteroides chelonae]QQG86883.1 hypothetical protein HBA99_06290 [Mycobacteroides chelonae]QQG91699.1 hypothetical protein HBA97_06290 [Mycobacteroides chelonae]